MQAHVARVTIGLSMLLVGTTCSPSTSTSPRPRNEGVVDLAIAPIASLKASKIATTDAGAGEGGTCVLRLKAGRVRMTNPTCYLDTEVTKELGTLRYACSGDGEADARFGSQRYEGRIDRGELTLTITTELDWNDGCRWGTRATITGPVAKGRPSQLTWDYLDHVISGQGCSGICRASAKMHEPGDLDEDSDSD